MRKEVYLSGKISGLWYPYVWFKFATYDIFLTVLGYKVWNPIVEINKKIPLDETLMISLENLHKCDGVCFQFDWLWSDEAQIEFNVAVKREKKLVKCGIYTRKFYQFLLEKD